jgi:hypothetical protein
VVRLQAERLPVGGFGRVEGASPAEHLGELVGVEGTLVSRTFEDRGVDRLSDQCFGPWNVAIQPRSSREPRQHGRPSPELGQLGVRSVGRGLVPELEGGIAEERERRRRGRRKLEDRLGRFHRPREVVQCEGDPSPSLEQADITRRSRIRALVEGGRGPPEVGQVAGRPSAFDQCIGEVEGGLVATAVGQACLPEVDVGIAGERRGNILRAVGRRARGRYRHDR